VSRKVLTNALLLGCLKLAAPALSLAIVAAVSRRLGAEGLGRYSLAYAWLTVFGLLAPLGLPVLLTREGARDPSRLARLLSSGLILSGGVSVVLAALLAALAPVLGSDPEAVEAVRMVAPALLPAAWAACCEAAFLALERAGPVVAASLVEHALKVGLGAALLYSGDGLNAVLGAAVLGKLAACVFSLVWLRRLGVRVKPLADRATLRSLLRRAPVPAASAVCATLYWRIDVFLLSYLRGAAEAGLYTAAYRLLDLAILLPQSLCQSLLPVMAANGAAAGAAANSYRSWLAALTVPVAAVLTVAGAPVLGVLYGERFRLAAPVLAVLIWAAAPYAWNRYRACVLVARDRQGADLGINAGLLGLNAALNLSLIPAHGALGAAAVTLSTGLLYGAAQMLYLRRTPAEVKAPA